MENKKEKIAAVVVTYNRKGLLKECLDALLNQTYPLDSIIIIDNASTDGTPEFLKENGYLDNPKIDYVRLPENTGGAGGFYEGVKRGYKEGFDWLWLMDDDVKPQNDCLEKLLINKKIIYKHGGKPTALACQRIFVGGEIVKYDCKKINLSNPFLGLHQNHISEKDLSKQYLEIEGVPFEGLLLNAQSINEIGFPDKRFFIFGDDTDYCLRILKIGRIYYIPSAKITKLILPKKIRKYNWKSYYMIRNLIYLDLKYAKLSVKLIRIPFNLLRLVLGRIYKIDLGNIPVIFKSFKGALEMYQQKYNYF